MYDCKYCDRELDTKLSRVQHEESCHVDEEECVCDDCGNEFDRWSSLMQHLIHAHDYNDEDFDSDGRIGDEVYTCPFPYCGRECDTELALVQHCETFHGKSQSIHCPECRRWFQKESSMMQHYQSVHDDCATDQTDTEEDNGTDSSNTSETESESEESLEGYLRERVSRINVTLTDRRKSRQVVQRILDQLGGCLDYYGSVFKKQFIKSGSYATNTKITKADEFDFDVPLKYSLEEIHIKRKGHVYYDFRKKQATLNLNVPMRVIHTKDHSGIPSGYVEVQTNTGVRIIPRKIQEEFYKDLQCAVDNFEYVDLQKKAQGPALTLVIHQPGSHNISVDFSPSLATNQVTLKDFNWPRQETRKVLPKNLIKTIFDVGLHLVPKKLKFWYISVSYAGRALMNGMDLEDSGCRKSCHKLLKADFQTWLGQSNHQLSGISTMIFKHQLFWMNEDNPSMNWSRDQLSKRYLDMLQDLSSRLRKGEIYNYFRDVENVLQGMDEETLNRVANLADKRRRELLNMD
ncbi:uncharacterized protein LOC130629029 [Hydractinia symbiolongicarpus]|uniref:uncharacterized protein LOC130629029 n=1 Tax=Hydractinia symbiolongicarpus TaxID=13093 RepID=UPI00254A6B7B|nr:uncharacterized protein LOC130629029 [Hydractinia symbiolongicarpus]